MIARLWSLIPLNIRLGLAVIVLMAFAALYFRGEHERHRAEAFKAERDRVKAELVQAQAQTKLTDTASRITDAATSKALTITVKSQELASHVQAQPGASEGLPSGLRDATLAAIRELRQPTATAGVADDPGGAKPSLAVSAP